MQIDMTCGNPGHLILSFIKLIIIGNITGLLLGFLVGRDGVAAATVLSRGACIFCIVYLVRKVPILHLKKADLQIISSQLPIGIPMGIQHSKKNTPFTKKGVFFCPFPLPIIKPYKANKVKIMGIVKSFGKKEETI